MKSSFSTIVRPTTAGKLSNLIETTPKYPTSSITRKTAARLLYNGKKVLNWPGGEYIWIAESDDVARSTFLEECMNAFSSYSDVSIVFSDCLFVDENTRDMHETKLQLTYRLSDKKQDSPYTMYNGRFLSTTACSTRIIS